MQIFFFVKKDPALVEHEENTLLQITNQTDSDASKISLLYIATVAHLSIAILYNIINKIPN